MRRTARIALLLVTALLAPCALVAAVFESGERQVGLLELYSSEGCSSCPPADRWLAGLQDDARLWREFVPVAFHVDYWDDLGWKDRFAAPAWSARQQRYEKEGGIGTVYTPGVVYNGKEWTTWRITARWRLTPGDAVGPLRAELAGDALRVRFTPRAATAAPVIVTVALLGADLTTQVAAGENRGRELRHGFVVLAAASVPLQPDAAAYAGTVALPMSPILAPRRALAVWVSAGNSLQPLQATGGWLDETPDVGI